ncbi:hypothetical protein TKK_0014504 [Trichogramma kaykai]
MSRCRCDTAPPPRCRAAAVQLKWRQAVATAVALLPMSLRYRDAALMLCRSPAADEAGRRKSGQDGGCCVAKARGVTRSPFARPKTPSQRPMKMAAPMPRRRNCLTDTSTLEMPLNCGEMIASRRKNARCNWACRDVTGQATGDENGRSMPHNKLSSSDYCSEVGKCWHRSTSRCRKGPLKCVSSHKGWPWLLLLRSCASQAVRKSRDV